MSKRCFDCGAKAGHRHHVVPKNLGGTKRVWLCTRCHGLIHGIDYGTDHVGATIRGLKRARARGVKLGRRQEVFVDIIRIDELRVLGWAFRRIAKHLGYNIATMHRAWSAATKSQWRWHFHMRNV